MQYDSPQIRKLLRDVERAAPDGVELLYRTSMKMPHIRVTCGWEVCDYVEIQVWEERGEVIFFLPSLSCDVQVVADPKKHGIGYVYEVLHRASMCTKTCYPEYAQ